MNKIYRIVWSESRRTWVVAHEKASAKGRPSTTKRVVAAAVAAALLGAAPAWAADVCGSGATTLGSSPGAGNNCVLETNGDSVTVNSGVSITGTSVGIVVNSSVAAGAIDNAGTVNASLTGLLLNSNASATAITNSGTLVGGGGGIFLTPGASVGGILNSGRIEGTTRDGIDLVSATVNGSIDNQGVVVGGGTGIGATGTSITGSLINGGTVTAGTKGFALVGSRVDGDVVNEGLIDTTGVSGYGMYLYAVTTVTGGVTNSGTITTSGNGIYFAGGSYLGGDIVNSGSVSAGATGIAIKSGSTMIGGVTNTGTIDAVLGVNIGVDIGGSVVNSGVIDAVSGIGLWVHSGSTMGGGVTNSGTIHSQSSNAFLLGAGSTVGGGFVNSGTLSADSGDAFVITDNSLLSGGVSNSGTLYSQSADAFVVKGGGTVDGDFDNGGTVRADSGIAVLIKSGSTLTGTLTNSGTINGGVSGLGLKFGAFVGGDVRNTGMIEGATKKAIMLTYATVSGSITNSGTLVGGKTGIYADTSSITGSLINSGTVTAGTKGFVLISSHVDGDVVNGGRIAITGTAGSGIYLYGSTTVTGGVTNSGTITTSGKGIYFAASSYLGGDIVNSGSVSAGATGIVVLSGSTVVGGVTNSGGISAVTGDAVLIRSGTMLMGGVTNSGTLHSQSSDALVINAGGEVYGGLDNGGTVSAVSGAGVLIKSGGTLSGGVTNSGTIYSQSEDAFVVENGGSISGNFDNRGAITVVSGTAVLIQYGSTLTGTLSNNGTIAGGSGGIVLLSGGAVAGGLSNSGTVSGADYAVYVDGYSDLPTIEITGTSARFIGDVYAPDSDVTLASGASFGNDNAFDVNSVTVSSGATFTLGAGTSTAIGTDGISVASGFTNAGIAVVDAGTSTTIHGDYTQASGGLLEVGAISTSDYGSLNITGTATLTGSTVEVRADPNNTLAVGNTLTDVLSAGALSDVSSGDSVTVLSSPLFTMSGVVDGSTIDVSVDSATTFNALLSGANPSLGGVGGALDALAGSYTGSGNLDPLLDQLYSLTTTDDLEHAVESLTPQVVAGLSNATGAAMHAVSGIVRGRASGASSGDGYYYADRHFWAKPFYSQADQGTRNGTAGYKADTAGIVVGVDGETADGTRIGGAFAYASTDVDAKTASKQSGSTDSYQAIVYGSHSIDSRTGIDFQADYGVHNNDSSRNIVVGAINETAKGSYDSWSAHAGVGVHRSYPMNADTTLTPTLRADYTYVHNKGYSETGAGADGLTVSAYNSDELLLSLDGKVDHTLDSGATLTANLGLGYDAIAPKHSITASFVGGGTAFTTEGIKPSRWVANGGVGVVVNTSKSMQVTARYDVEARNSDFTNQTVSVKVRMPF